MTVRPLRRIGAGVYESRDGRWRFVGPAAISPAGTDVDRFWHIFDLEDKLDQAAWGEMEPTLQDAVEAVDVGLEREAAHA
jgi:hypothetical protein